jgi:hypothetical protein
VIPVYRVVFANNSIISCEAEEKPDMRTDVYYVKDRRGRIVFAYIKAKSLRKAIAKASELVIRFANGTTR